MTEKSNTDRVFSIFRELNRIPRPSHHEERIAGGLGGHSGVDINKGRCSAVEQTKIILKVICKEEDIAVANIQIGDGLHRNVCYSLLSSGDRLRSVGLVPITPSGTAILSFLKCFTQYLGRFPLASRQFMGLALKRCRSLPDS